MRFLVGKQSLLGWCFRILLFCSSCATTSPSTYAFSPSSRTLHPKAIYKTTGNVTSASGEKDPSGIFHMTGPHASVTYDFGQIVAGIPTLLFHNAVCKGGACKPNFQVPGFSCTGACQAIGIAYTESELFIGTASDLSVDVGHPDGTLYVPLTEKSYTVPGKWGRGSFRYLTLSFNRETSPLTSVGMQFSALHYTAAPNVPADSLRTYSGYFDSSDDLLNRIWYAGVNTLQLCTVGAHTSVDHTYLAFSVGWADDAKATNLTAQQYFLADGAKRDRNTWAGDVGIFLRTAQVSQNFDNLLAVRNTLQEIIILQDKTHGKTSGYFPYAGSPLGDLLIAVGPQFGIAPYGSDTYHLWLIASFAEYFLVTKDLAWAKIYWSQIVTGIQATYPFVDADTGLFKGTRTEDWGRIGQGGQNTALNALYYYALRLSAEIAPKMPEDADAEPQRWLSMAEKVKSSANSLLFDSATGLFRDNLTSAGQMVHPQDGNSLAINFNLTKSTEQAQTISAALAKRLTKYGAPAPELPGSISPFMSGHELNAQFRANPGDASQAMNLLRTSWGYMLSAFSETTFVEGYGADGSLTYGFYGNYSAFISNVHAWSTAPTYSLLHFVVGLRTTALEVLETDGSWAFKPAAAGSGLSEAKGGYNSTAGEFDGSWTLSAKTFDAEFKVPSDLQGTIYVPTFGAKTSQLRLQVDGKTVKKYVLDGPYIRIPDVSGGSHSISLKF